MLVAGGPSPEPPLLRGLTLGTERKPHKSTGMAAVEEPQAGASTQGPGEEGKNAFCV